MQCSTSSLPQNILINLIAKHLNDIINRVEGKLRKHIMFRHFNNTIDAVEDKKATHGKVRTQFFCLVHSKGYF